MKRPMTVLYVAAQEDEPLRQRLERHLTLLEQRGLMQGWHVQQILAGSVEVQSREAALQSASLVLLLISADFFASPVCQEQMQQALEWQRRGEMQVIPILVRRVDGKGALFAHLQALPSNGKPIASWLNEDEALTEVAKGVRRVLEEDHLPMATASRTGLPPIWNVPYPRNALFVGQDDVLTQLHQQLQAGQTTALSQSPRALSGLGGIGKTQIAMEYAYRYAQEYQMVLWAQAESQETLQASYVEMASLLNLPEQEAQEQEKIIQAVKQWLQRHQGWLLIFDNVDTLKILPAFLPPLLGGHLLLTTRASAMGRLAQRIEVQMMDEEQGALLLLRRAGRLAVDGTLEQASEAEQMLARQMSEALGGLPLALDQAGAYLEETGCGLASYTTIYQQHRKELLSKRGGLVQDHLDAVATTWLLSFQKVEVLLPVAADLLRVCAFLSPDAIPEEMFTQGAAALGPHLAPVAGDMFLLNQAIEALRGYSLVRRDPEMRTLSIHRLVQAVLKDEMQEATKKEWRDRVIRAVAMSAPEVEQKYWRQWERMVVHALVCAKYIEQRDHVIPEAGKLLNQTGTYLVQRGRYQEADLLFQRALHLREEQYGQGHLETANAMSQVAWCLWLQGKYREAEPLVKQTLEIKEQELGSRHLSTATSVNNLAALYKSQGKYGEAEPLYKRTLKIREQELESGHPLIAMSLNNLAGLYQAQGKYTLVEPLLLRALEIRMQKLGPRHSLTAISMNDLATLYQAQGKYGEAESLYKQALEISEQELGLGHPDTAMNVNNLAGLYQVQGKYTEAEPLVKRALEIYEQQLGLKHPSTTTSVNNLGMLYKVQGKYVEAELLLKQVLAMREQELGLRHPDTATSVNNLGMFYREQGKYTEAEALLKQGLAMREQLLGAMHPDTARSLNDLAALYYMQGKYTEAEPLFLRALEISEQSLGLGHPDTAGSLNNLAGLYQAQGKYAEAELLFLRALAMDREVYGADHPGVATDMNNLACLYQTQGKYGEAEPLFLRALEIGEQILGPRHPNTATSLNNLAEFYSAQGKYTEAEPLYERALEIRERSLRPGHPDTAVSVNNLALLYYAQENYTKAEPLLKRALEIEEQELGPGHPDTATNLNNLSALYYAQGKYGEAESLVKRALEIWEQSLGGEYPTTKIGRGNYAALLRKLGREEEVVALEVEGD